MLAGAVLPAARCGAGGRWPLTARAGALRGAYELGAMVSVTTIRPIAHPLSRARAVPANNPWVATTMGSPAVPCARSAFTAASMVAPVLIMSSTITTGRFRTSPTMSLADTVTASSRYLLTAASRASVSEAKWRASRIAPRSGATSAVITESGHNIALENPAALAKAYLDFFADP
jgi:pimeloyl-ACP methyl ester carboxylesterase